MEQQETSRPQYWQETAASEVARLFFGNPYMMESLEDLLPPAINLTQVHKVLDIGCGTGEWACRLAKANPQFHVIGIDTSHQLIQAAVDQAAREGLRSVAFYQFDTAQSLEFASESFDVVHVHSLASFISTSMWSKILEEMIRLIKLNGWINIVDYEQGSTSSPAFNRLSVVGLAGVRALGGSVSPSSTTQGVAARLYSFLVDAGMIDVAYTVHAVDYGVNSHPGTRQFLDDLVTGMVNFKPFVLQLGLIESRLFDRLIEQAKEELYAPDSCGYAYLISAIGRKGF